MKYIMNAWSFKMLRKPNGFLAYHEIDIEDFDDFIKDENGQLYDDVISVMGQENIANILKIPYNRENIVLNKGDTMYVVYVEGRGRIPENATTLPKGMELRITCAKIIEDKTIGEELKGVV